MTDVRKKCRACGIVQPLQNFHRRSTSTDGRRAECKGCVKAYMVMRYRLKNVELRKQQKVYYAAHREKIKQAVRKYAQKNSAVIRYRKKQYYANNRRFVIDRVRTRASNPLIALALKFQRRERYDRNKGNVLTVTAVYQQTPKGKEARLKATRNYRAKNPARQMAYKAVAWALQSGRLQRPTTCVLCKCLGKIHAHHHKGYERDHQLDVQWICAKCHAAIHRVTRLELLKSALGNFH